MKVNANKNRTDVQFQVGEQVLLKLQLYAQSSLLNRTFPKLAMKYFGLYKVIKRVGQAAYKLELPTESLIHPTFHVSQLKSFVPDHTPMFTELPKQLQMDVTDVAPEAILQQCLRIHSATVLSEKRQYCNPTSPDKMEAPTIKVCHLGGFLCHQGSFSTGNCLGTSKF